MSLQPNNDPFSKLHCIKKTLVASLSSKEAHKSSLNSLVCQGQGSFKGYQNFHVYRVVLLGRVCWKVRQSSHYTMNSVIVVDGNRAKYVCFLRRKSLYYIMPTSHVIINTSFLVGNWTWMASLFVFSTGKRKIFWDTRVSVLCVTWILNIAEWRTVSAIFQFQFLTVA